MANSLRKRKKSAMLLEMPKKSFNISRWKTKKVRILRLGNSVVVMLSYFEKR